jgi:RNA polymerase sigma factor (sigma-70 family)
MESQFMTDAELIEEYRAGSGDAFASLVRRHMDWVYSVARRRVIDADLAEDVAQASFIVLLRKAPQLRSGQPLSPWLFGVVNLACKQALRNESRRRRRETEAADMRSKINESMSGESIWADLAPEVDQLVERLRSGDRQAILLRFYECKSMSEVGIAMGISEEAARKRVSRAVDRLGNLLRRSGKNISASALMGVLLAELIKPAPATMAGMIGIAGENAAALVKGVISTMTWTKVKLSVAAIAGLLVFLIAAFELLPGEAVSPARAMAPQNHSTTAPTAADDMPISMRDAKTKDSIPAPWPLALAGYICGAPTPAQLDDDPDLEIVVACMERTDDHLAHPHPTMAAKVYAFKLDGTVLKGWPVTIQSSEEHLANQKTNADHADDWFGSPLAIDIDGDGKDEIIIAAPNGKSMAERSVCVIHHDGRLEKINVGGWKPDPWSTIAAADVAHNGEIELLGAYASVQNGKVDVSNLQTWPGAFTPAAGDVNGDGKMEFFVPNYPSNGDSANVLINGYDSTGRRLAGWPQKKAGNFTGMPVIGDITGDSKKEIVCAGRKGLLAWSADGKALGPGGVLVADAYPSSHETPTLADLDGDGKAEIVLFDGHMHALRAWRGDGRGFGNEQGIIAKLPGYSTVGVSVANLDGDGGTDFFAGAYWIHLSRDQKVQVTAMIDGDKGCESQSVITDLDHDGKADILFAASDGKVCIYHTGKPYKPSSVQWATWGGNFAHTGCWEPAKK